LLGAVRPESPIPPGQERGAIELAALMGAPQPERDRIAATVKSWSRFPPEEEAGQMLWRALAACSMTNRPEAQRVDLALRLYAITNGTNVPDRDLAATLTAYRRAAAEARCSPQAAVDLENALTRIARTDPRPRADWW
jgi:hypothetical protein